MDYLFCSFKFNKCKPIVRKDYFKGSEHSDNGDLELEKRELPNGLRGCSATIDHMRAGTDKI